MAHQEIDILVVVDTAYVKATYGKNNNADKPTGIDHQHSWMIATNTRGIISGQGTGDLNFKANVGDTVAFFGTSIYQNSQDAIIIYGIPPFPNQTSVFNKFATNDIVLKGSVQANPNTDTGIPPNQVASTFASYDAKVQRGGTEQFQVQFALYELDQTGENQVLFGYYQWDPTITVQ